MQVSVPPFFQELSKENVGKGAIKMGGLQLPRELFRLSTCKEHG